MVQDREQVLPKWERVSENMLMADKDLVYADGEETVYADSPNGLYADLTESGKPHATEYHRIHTVEKK